MGTDEKEVDIPIADSCAATDGEGKETKEVERERGEEK